MEVAEGEYDEEKNKSPSALFPLPSKMIENSSKQTPFLTSVISLKVNET